MEARLLHQKSIWSDPQLAPMASLFRRATHRMTPLRNTSCFPQHLQRVCGSLPRAFHFNSRKAQLDIAAVAAAVVPSSSSSSFSSGHRYAETSTSAAKTNAEYLQGLSTEQLDAVTGPLVPTRVVAGPGSGKTRVLTSRIAHLISHYGVKPWQIVAITFTNKAANEMRERLAASLGPAVAHQLFAGTFHSLCYRILRRSLSTLPNTGRTDGWSLYDQDAAQAVIYKLVKAAHSESKTAQARGLARAVQSRISGVKNALGTCYGMSSSEAVYQYYQLIVTKGGPLSLGEEGAAKDLATWFDLYEEAMRAANALDFDDLLGYATALLQRDENLRGKLRQRWRYILVDEFQDTNSPQYELIKLLAASRPADGDVFAAERPLFAVGDPDQAIYGWRGADVRNMRHLFGVDFPTGDVYRLRDNYRSTPSILTAAQAVISRNEDEGRGNLRAQRPPGPPIQVDIVEDAYEEAELIASEISSLISSNACRDKDIAVLFRTHQQARLIETHLVKKGIKYVLVGGVPFWRRVEIQDVMAYLRLAVTLDDEVALERVINVPKRGLGDVSVAKLAAAAEEREESLSRMLWDRGLLTPEALSSTPDSSFIEDAENGSLVPLPVVSQLLTAKTAAAVEKFRSAVWQMRRAVATQPLGSALAHIIECVDYQSHVEKGGCGGNDDDIDERLQRLQQLQVAANEFMPGTAAGAAALDAAFAALDEEDDGAGRRTPVSGASEGQLHEDEPSPDATVEERLAVARSFLDEAALYSGAEDGENVDGVRLMTMHAAKGLEFEHVFVPGCNDGLVPLVGDSSSLENLEEETRLFFVSMTRAKHGLRLIHSKMHKQHGSANIQQNVPSRFLWNVMQSGHAERNEGYANDGDGGGSRSGRRGDAGVRSERYSTRITPTSGDSSKSTSLSVAAKERKLTTAQKLQQKRAGRR